MNIKYKSMVVTTALLVLVGCTQLDKEVGYTEDSTKEEETYSGKVLRVEEGYDTLSYEYREQGEFKRKEQIRKEEIRVQKEKEEAEKELARLEEVEKERVRKEEESKLTKEQVVEKVKSGEYGTGEERDTKVKNLGYDPKEVQGLVNKADEKVKKTSNTGNTSSGGSNTGGTSSGTSQSAPKEVEEVQGKGTIRVNGKTFQVGKYFDETQTGSLQGYIDKGNIGVQWGYFKVNNTRGTHVSGHAPGVFGSLSGNVGVGTVISVVDWDGAHKNYTVKQVVTMEHSVQGIPADVQEIYNKVVGRDSFVLQFCLNSVNQLYYAE